MVGIDPVHLASYAHQLSGGMRQRAMIAMALLFSPELILMDEPTSALDVVAQRSLMVQIKQLQAELGFAIIFVTHDMSLVSHFSDRVAVMYAGQVVETRPTRSLFDNPLHPYTRGLLDSFPSVYGPKVLVEGIPGSPPISPAFPPVATSALAVPRRPSAAVPASRPCARSMTPWFVACFTKEGRRAVTDAEKRPQDAASNLVRADPVLEARGLTRHFRIGGLRGHTLHAVDDLDMGIAEREIVALVGESGSGKSTVARLLAMVYRPTSGEILFRGQPVSSLRRRRQVLAYRGQVPMVFQDPFSSLNPAHTIGYALVPRVEAAPART